MPTFRPSSRAALVAGALAVTLVVGATSGAVAGKLITSKDIKNHTIVAKDIATGGVKKRNLAKNSVDWSAQLNQKTRKRITALAGADGVDGLTGPAGPAGPPGAPGADGSRGPRGLPGGGLVGSAVFGPTYDPSTVIPISDGSIGEESSQIGSIDLPGPGTYLITVNAVFASTPGALFFKDPGPSGPDFSDPDEYLKFYGRSCSGLILPVCQVSLPYVVPAGSGPSVPLRIFALGDTCGCYGFPLQASVAVFEMDGDNFALSAVRSPRLHGREAQKVADQLKELTRQPE